MEGNTIGYHHGLIRYTVGQRRGLHLPMKERVYVVSKDPAGNTMTVGPEKALFSRELLATNFNWLSVSEPGEPIHVKARTRYHQAECSAVVYPLSDSRVRVVFDDPQRAVTPGQAVVLYDGDIVLGGGTIS